MLDNDVRFSKQKGFYQKMFASLNIQTTFSLPRHRHEVNGSFTAVYPQGLAFEAIMHIKARMLLAQEMGALVLQMELDSIKMKEVDNP